MGANDGIALARMLNRRRHDSDRQPVRLGATYDPRRNPCAGVIPGKVRLVYQAPLSQEASRASLTVVPLFSSCVKGLAVSFAF
jgi:hypothetical protein